MAAEQPVEVFEVVKKGTGYGLAVHPTLANALKNHKRAKTHITAIENLLNHTDLKKNVRGLDPVEQKALWHAMKAKWEHGLSNNFKLEYKVNLKKHPLKIARMLTNEIVKKVNMTIGDKLAKYADKVEGVVDDKFNQAEFKASLKAVGHYVTDAEAKALWKHMQEKEKKKKKEEEKKSEEPTPEDLVAHRYKH